MTYEETTQYLFKQTANYEQQGQNGYKPGLETIQALDKVYGYSSKAFKSIHIAGTNGKGSCSHMLAAILQQSGYRTGLFTSPHLVDFSERIRVNGEPIDKAWVTDFVEKGQKQFEELGATFFEITTVMAFKYFADKNVDIAVIETGLGGRLDSTNIITPLVSLITNISLDHTELLGNSEEQIAMEKGGIIKEGVPVIIGEATPATRPVFEALAQENHAPITFAEEQAEVVRYTHLPQGGYHYVTQHLGEFDCELDGDYQPLNMSTMLPVLKELSMMGYLSSCETDHYRKIVTDEMNYSLTNVCKLTGLKGRWQKLQDKPCVICDTGHNIGAWQYLGPQIAAQPCTNRRIVFGMLEDKDVFGVMSMLPQDATYYFCRPSSERALPEQSLQLIAQQVGLSGNAYASPKEAFEVALKEAGQDDFIFVGGSNYIVADILKSTL